MFRLVRTPVYYYNYAITTTTTTLSRATTTTTITNNATTTSRLADTVSSATDRLTHVGSDGKARMVDVSTKHPTKRTAIATATVDVGTSVFDLIKSDQLNHKGDVLTVAQIAGIQAAKQTATLIPLCHQLPLAHAGVSFRLVAPRSVVVTAQATTAATAQTGVEMEALTAASVAALTVYDMCKAASKAIVIREVRLLEKTGGKSKDYRAVDV